MAETLQTYEIKKRIPKKVRFIVALALLLLIVFVSLYIYNTGEDVFKQKVVKRYPNNCEEIYVDGMLTTPKCNWTETDSNINPKAPLQNLNYTLDI